jgi:hypothetical protein
MVAIQGKAVLAVAGRALQATQTEALALLTLAAAAAAADLIF